eukprot:CAMPEP_0118963962 /NCGR_PEP_ID=MMETSP1173-20130426/1785_1 /TAXON_ID=1034831 /ORGANISM="Rhizochromulina marina cf, Strain CCMP1243" /LENGTH=178 /DNA_ID=CAMNT_0006912383 /DNA_START=98 /DNA_END=630 /DNA_ORIENTATION=-
MARSCDTMSHLKLDVFLTGADGSTLWYSFEVRWPEGSLSDDNQQTLRQPIFDNSQVSCLSSIDIDDTRIPVTGSSSPLLLSPAVSSRTNWRWGRASFPPFTPSPQRVLEAQSRQTGLEAEPPLNHRLLRRRALTAPYRPHSLVTPPSPIEGCTQLRRMQGWRQQAGACGDGTGHRPLP